MKFVQLVRIFDVAILMPYLFHLSGNKKLSGNERTGLKLIATGTGIYNGIRWYIHETSKEAIN